MYVHDSFVKARHDDLIRAAARARRARRVRRHRGIPAPIERLALIHPRKATA